MNPAIVSLFFAPGIAILALEIAIHKTKIVVSSSEIVISCLVIAIARHEIVVPKAEITISEDEIASSWHGTTIPKPEIAIPKNRIAILNRKCALTMGRSVPPAVATLI